MPPIDADDVWRFMHGEMDGDYGAGEGRRFRSMTLDHFERTRAELRDVQTRPVQPPPRAASSESTIRPTTPRGQGQGVSIVTSLGVGLVAMWVAYALTSSQGWAWGAFFVVSIALYYSVEGQ